jgi:hypothetical protein
MGIDFEHSHLTECPPHSTGLIASQPCDSPRRFDPGAIWCHSNGRPRIDAMFTQMSLHIYVSTGVLFISLAIPRIAPTDDVDRRRDRRISRLIHLCVHIRNDLDPRSVTHELYDRVSELALVEVVDDAVGHDQRL